MNKTMIEWCTHTWNPITGCRHNCPYCYARKIAERFRETPAFPVGFTPVLRQERLAEPLPKDRFEPVDKYRKIFVCSMGDMFGQWVPERWKLTVLGIASVCWLDKFIFLTKDPRGFETIKKNGMDHDHLFFGISAETQEVLDTRVLVASNYLTRMFISLEPLQGPINLTDTHFKLVRGVIIGSETGNRKGKVIPKQEWVEDIIEKCEDFKIPLFVKDNSMLGRMGPRETLW